MNTAVSLSSTSTRRAPWLLLFGRSALFAGFQGLFALAIGALSTASPGAAWDASAAWWPVGVTLTNLVCLAALTRLYRAEGSRYWDLFRFRRGQAGRDLLALLGVMVITGPVAFLPNTTLATWLYGDPQGPLPQFLGVLPLWAAYASLILFPLTQALTELPLYFAYVMPRLARQTGRPWLALVLSAGMLGVQHAFIPLRFDPRFFTWRLLMFVPFAFLVGLVLRWRPSLLPYLVIVHGLMDFAAVLMLPGILG